MLFVVATLLFAPPASAVCVRSEHPYVAWTSLDADATVPANGAIWVLDHFSWSLTEVSVDGVGPLVGDENGRFLGDGPFPVGAAVLRLAFADTEEVVEIPFTVVDAREPPTPSRPRVVDARMIKDVPEDVDLGRCGISGRHECGDGGPSNAYVVTIESDAVTLVLRGPGVGRDIVWPAVCGPVVVPVDLNPELEALAAPRCFEIIPFDALGRTGEVASECVGPDDDEDAGCSAGGTPTSLAGLALAFVVWRGRRSMAAAARAR